MAEVKMAVLQIDIAREREIKVTVPPGIPPPPSKTAVGMEDEVKKVDVREGSTVEGSPLSTSSSITDSGDGAVEEGEEQNPVFILPEEVWMMVFEKLEAPRDLLNTEYVCTLFRGLLKPTKSTWLFSEIFKHVFPYLTKREILNCRQTGREWNRVVDSYFQNHGYYRPFDEVTNDDRHGETTIHFPLKVSRLAWTEFHSSEEILRYTEVLKNPVRNPFLGRALWFQFAEELGGEAEPHSEMGWRRKASPPPFWELVFQFLAEYGEHVWYLNLGTHGPKNTASRFLYILRNCLIHLPNLKSLHIFGWIADEQEFSDLPFEGVYEADLFDVDARGANFFIEDEDLLQDYLDRKPLPLPSSLETLEIEYMEDLPDVIYQHLIRVRGEQLKCLRFTNESFVRMTNLPNLKELHLKLRSLDQFENYISRLSSPLLGKLNLDFSVIESHMDVDRLFRLISNNFGDTIRVLQISVIPNTYQNISSLWDQPATQWNLQPRLRTPHLQTLQLKGFIRISLNFILSLSSSLQFLHLRHMSTNHRVVLHPNEVIDIYQFMHVDKLYESNVWSVMPKLKTLSVDYWNKKEQTYLRRFYHREMHDYLVDEHGPLLGAWMDNQVRN